MSVSRVENLIADGLFNQALELINDIDGFTSQLLGARLNIDQGKISETISTLDVICTKINQHSNLYLEYLILRSDVYLYHGDIPGGIEMGLDILGKIAENYFIDDSDFDIEHQHNRTLFILAALHMDKGENIKALKYIELIQPRNVVDRSKILNNKGIIQFNLNHYEEARKYFDEALVNGEKMLPNRQLLSILNNQAMIKHTFGDMWKKLSSMDSTLRERIELSGLDKTIESLISNAFIKEIEVKNEKPVGFLILDKSGSTRYKYAFEVEMPIHDQLIGALISALNLLSAEIFEKEGNLERIKHEKYSIVIKTVDTFMFCYIFVGNSFFAVDKLNKTVNKIQENQGLWDVLLDRITVIPEDEPDIKLIVENYLI